MRPSRHLPLLSCLCLTITSCVVAGEAIDPTQARLPGATSRRGVEFARDVMPALTKAGCNAGACHGSFQGKGGLQLSLLGFDPAYDHDVLVKNSRGRRVHPAAPERSLLWTKPTGLAPHGGGVRIAVDSEVATLIRDWIAAGMPGPRPEETAGVTLRVEPSTLVLAPPRTGEASTSSSAIADAAATGVQLRVTATWGDGTVRDVTPWALFDARDKSVVDVGRGGLVAARRPGKTSVSVRYLGQVASVSVSAPYGPPTEFAYPTVNFIDELIAVEWRKLGVKPATVADDATFVRRVYLDLIGTLPTPDETRRFVASGEVEKRARLIDDLLARPEYVDYWSLKWGDLLRSHRRYLGEKGLASFNGWIRQSVRDNKPLDVLTRELLTAQGNLFTNGPVAYFFIDEKVEDLAETTSQVFLGVRLQCTKCHHHPNETWSQEDYYGLAAFFTHLESKDSGAQGAKFGGPKSVRAADKANPNRTLKMPVPPRVFGVESAEAATPVMATPVMAAAASGESGAAGGDPRRRLADWITRVDNPYFARNFANRYWAALMGTGLVEPVDDLRATNPSSLPTVLDALARDLAAHQFDVKHLLRTICNSRTYQLATELRPARDVDGALFTHRRPRRLSAEVLLDAINQVTAASENFTGQPQGTRAIALPDPTIASNFLATFGRPLRNSPCECARGVNVDLSQALHLANSVALHEKIGGANGRLAGWLKAGKTDDEVLDELYLAALSRRPTDAERAAVRESLAAGVPREEAWQDVVWAVVNCAEFVFGH